MELQRGDTVTILAGPFTGKEGKIVNIIPDPSREEGRVYVVTCTDDSGVSVPLWPSQVSRSATHS